MRPEERLGTVLSDRYRLDRILGKGGQGVVFGGVHVRTGRAVAVKLLLPQYADEPHLIKRFFQEARAAAALKHPHVVDVLDLHEDDDGESYIALELLEGEPMSALLKRETTIEVDRLLAIVLPVMDALATAHQQGILHRDLKPDNLFLAKGVRGRVHPKLLDFGISKLLESESIATATGGVLGTPHYMSPEQAKGDKSLDGRADVWAMAVVCFRALTGKLPFTGDAPTLVLVKIMTEDPPAVRDLAPDVPEPIAAVIDRGLSPLRSQRVESMAHFMTALVDACAEAGVALPERLVEYRGREDEEPPPPTPEPPPPAEPLPETKATAVGKKRKAEPEPEDESPPTRAAKPRKPDPDPTTIERMLLSDPLGADVTIDGVRVGETPLSVVVPVEGTVDAVVSERGFEARTVTLSGRVTDPETVRLTRARHRPPDDDLAPQ